ncbi:MAG: SH3 domain-containing protein, partial [Peptostreptococcaceae bacterium]
EILETSSGWHKVKLSNGTTGWASSQYISTSSSGGSSSDNNSGSNNGSTTVSGTATVTASTLNIRSGASTSHSVIAKAYKGDKVELLESSNGWNKVKLSNGTTGWASSEYLSTSSSSDNNSGSNNGSTTVSGTATVTASALNIRSGASTSHSVVAKAYKGDKVELLESLNGWYKVKLSNGTTGWASSEYLSTSSSGGSSSDNNTSSQDKVQKVLDVAHAQLGKPYVWGAEGPNSFDCSGLTYYVYKQAGVSLPRTSKEQYSKGTSVSKSNLQAGDLIFSSTDGSGSITHVAIYVGDGYMIHAPRSGKNVEKVSINNSYWQNAYVGAKRVL